MLPSVTKMFSLTNELNIYFPKSQVWLSQRRPPNEERIDHNEMKLLTVVQPSETYAYTTEGPLVIKFSKEVQILSFWLRLHRSPDARVARTEGTRRVQVHGRNGILVSEDRFLLTSDEWVLVRPSLGDGAIQGDTLTIQSKTDVDSIVVRWGKQVINDQGRILFKHPGGQNLVKFTAYKVVKDTEDQG